MGECRLFFQAANVLLWAHDMCAQYSSIPGSSSVHGCMLDIVLSCVVHDLLPSEPCWLMKLSSSGTSSTVGCQLGFWSWEDAGPAGISSQPISIPEWPFFDAWPSVPSFLRFFTPLCCSSLLHHFQDSFSCAGDGWLHCSHCWGSVVMDHFFFCILKFDICIVCSHATPNISCTSTLCGEGVGDHCVLST